jgi:ABC-type Na+ efflux pump permease subunit
MELMVSLPIRPTSLTSGQWLGIAIPSLTSSLVVAFQRIKVRVRHLEAWVKLAALMALYLDPRLH